MKFSIEFLDVFKITAVEQLVHNRVIIANDKGHKTFTGLDRVPEVGDVLVTYTDQRQAFIIADDWVHYEKLAKASKKVAKKASKKKAAKKVTKKVAKKATKKSAK